MNVQSIFSLIATRIQTDPLLDIVALLLIFALIRTVMLSRRITILTRGGDGKSLESAIKGLHERASALETHAKTAETALNNLDTRIQGSIRGVAVKRFDPFQNSGGQQSFATSFLDEHGNGAVVSGIHARDGVRVYAKEVKNFSSDRELSDEERGAIAEAQKKLQ